ncbi:MAG TPA: hypothetical protein EYP58_00940 [bacterium (Candidatus Stahlbacteria)]|nr:hypothetical protein [Candidatus Stahlbacteria bacterium]
MIILFFHLNIEQASLYEELKHLEKESFTLAIRRLIVTTYKSECFYVSGDELNFVAQDGSTTRLRRLNNIVTLNMNKVGVFDTVIIDTSLGLKRLTLTKSGLWQIIAWR